MNFSEIQRRPHTEVIVTIGFNVLHLFVEEPIDMVQQGIEANKRQEFLSLNVAMCQHHNSDLWNPNSDDNISYCVWRVKNLSIKAFHKCYKKQDHRTRVGFWGNDKDFQEPEIVKVGYEDD